MKTLLLTGILCLGAALHAANIRLTGIEVRTGEKSFVQCTLAWDHSRRTERNYDAAWVFLKFKPADLEYNARPVPVSVAGHEMIARGDSKMPVPRIEASPDLFGVYVYSSENYRGPVEWTLRIAVDASQYAGRSGSWELYAVEMVYIPESPFTIGDPDTSLLKSASFYRSGPGGAYGGLFEVADENKTVYIGKRPGDLYYRVSESEYQGDQKGVIPANFPKGVQAFYVMKYEITQGQYAAFLNSLGWEVTPARANFGGSAYAKSRGSIRFDGTRYVAQSPNRPLNFVGWDDGCAFADWAGLRPMTELEFEKAARGPNRPLPGEFPWGTAKKDRLARFVDLDDELKFSPGIDEGLLSDQTRDQIGASWYGVMDLAGSLWEKVVSVGIPAGRAFCGSHGDGRLMGYGYATNSDWPKGDNNPHAGFGYRGGGYYEHGKPEGEFNPHSPIGRRDFAAWSGGPRSIAYGFRCARTARPLPPQRNSTAESLIRDAVSAFSQKVVAADWEAVTNAYSEDARIFPPGQNILEGRDAIRKYWSSGGRMIYHKVTPSEIKIMGSEAYDWGVYEGRTLGSDGKETEFKGKYVIIWKETEPGDWRIYLDIWNRNPN